MATKSKIRLKVKAKKGLVDIKILIKHPMETGLRKNAKTGKNYPAHYITDLTVKANGDTVASSLVGASISRNPYFRFKSAGAKGDMISVSYIDNQGKSESVTGKSK